MHFPTWRYHATEAPVLVNDPGELEALGAEWADTPAAFDAKAGNQAPEPAEQQKKKTSKK